MTWTCYDPMYVVKDASLERRLPHEPVKRCRSAGTSILTGSKTLHEIIANGRRIVPTLRVHETSFIINEELSNLCPAHSVVLDHSEWRC